MKRARRRDGTNAINPEPEKTSGRSGKVTGLRRSRRKRACVMQEAGEYIVVDTGSMETAESVDELGAAPVDRVAEVIVGNSESNGTIDITTGIGSSQGTEAVCRLPKSKSAPGRPKPTTKVCKEDFKEGDLDSTSITQPASTISPEEMRLQNEEHPPPADAVSIDAVVQLPSPQPAPGHDQPSTTTSPGHAIPERFYTPPAITFTTDHGFKTALSRSDIRLFLRIFSKNARALLRSKAAPTQGRIYPVEALMTQTSTDFYKWYTTESQTDTDTSVLQFHPTDVAWYSEGTFLVPGGDLYYFRLLKQIIWDSFWLTLSSNKTPTPFHVLASHGDGAQYGSWQGTKPRVEGTASMTVTSYSTTRDDGLKTAPSANDLTGPPHVKNHESSLPLDESTLNVLSCATIPHDIGPGGAALSRDSTAMTPIDHFNCTTKKPQTDGSTTCPSLPNSSEYMLVDATPTTDTSETSLPSIQDLQLLPAGHKSKIHYLLNTFND